MQILCLGCVQGEGLITAAESSDPHGEAEYLGTRGILGTRPERELTGAAVRPAPATLEARQISGRG